MCRCSRTFRLRQVVLALAGILLTVVPAGNAQNPIRFTDVFENLTWRPGEFAAPLCRAALVRDVARATDALPSRLPDAFLRPVGRTAGDLLRIGAKQVTVADAVSWKHFEGNPGLWIDVLQFADVSAADRVFSQRTQAHSGRTNPNYFIFMAYGDNGDRDAVGAIFRNDRYLFNIGFDVPFSIREARGGDGEKLRSLNQIVDRFVATTEVVVRQVVAPEALTGAAGGPVTEQERRTRRLASFATLWSEVKYNFVFLGRRPEVDWDGLLEPYLARIAAVRSQEEYLRIMAEALALLRDGHMGVTFGGFVDRPPIRVAPIGGRPVVTAVGNTPELRASGVAPGMELVAVEGRPVDDVLKREVYPVVSASTPQGRDVVVRSNQGGDSSIGFAVIARLIAEATTQTSAERTRVYKPTERARGNAEGWYEYPRDRIEPRGDRPYLGP